MHHPRTIRGIDPALASPFIAEQVAGVNRWCGLGPVPLGVGVFPPKWTRPLHTGPGTCRGSSRAVSRWHGAGASVFSTWFCGRCFAVKAEGSPDTIADRGRRKRHSRQADKSPLREAEASTGQISYLDALRVWPRSHCQALLVVLLERTKSDMACRTGHQQSARFAIKIWKRIYS